MAVNRAGKRANLWVGGEAVADQGMSSISTGLKQNQTLTFAVDRENSARFIFSAEKIEKRKTVILLM